jgi:leader peptidase (prepilin peptidase) / N-methyltransferase
VTAAAVILVALLGAAIGSFLNVVAYRLPRGESLVSPGSHCPACGAPVRPRDNVPIVSWLLLRGRCRDCGQVISVRYPLIEALTAVVFASVAIVRGVDEGLVLELPFAALLIAVAAIDLEHRIVPNRIVVPGAVYAVAATAVINTGHLPEALAAGAAAFLGLLVAALAYPAGMGMGDVKLAGMMGLFLGRAVAPALLAAFLAGTIVGLVVLARDGVDARKRGVPFAPFLAFGGLVGVLVGPQLVDFYLDEFVR